MSDIKARVAFQVAQMYELYSLQDRDREPHQFPFKVPLAIQLNCSFDGEESEGVDLCFLVDCSSSMKNSPGEGWSGTPTRYVAVIETLQKLISDLGPNDRVAIVAFDHETTLVAELQPAADVVNLVSKIPEPRGATNIALALKAGTQAMAQRREDVPGALVLLTDGDAYVPTGPDSKLWRQNKDADLQLAFDEAVAATEELREAGLDLVNLGFGDEWNIELLNNMDGRVGAHGVRYIDTREKADEVLRKITSEQQESVLTQVRLEGELNTQMFRWEQVWTVLPCRAVSYPVSPRGNVDLDSVQGQKWSHTLSNVQHAATTGYTVLLTARPLPNLDPGTHLVGRFRVRVGKGVCTDWHDVSLVVKDKEITGSATDPQHPYEPVRDNWLEGLAIDEEATKNEHIKGKRHEEAQRCFEEIIRLRELAENREELAIEQQAYQAYCQTNDLSPAEIKKINEERTTTASSATRGIHNELMAFEEGAEVYVIEKKQEGEPKMKKDVALRARKKLRDSTHSILTKERSNYRKRKR